MQDPFQSYRTLGVGGGTGGTGGSGGFGSGNGGLAPQPGSGDSLTAWLRSLGNLTGTTGANLVGAGGNTTNMGLGTVGTGLDAQGKSLETLQPTIDFYSKLLSGDPATMTSVLAPTANLIGQQYETAKTGTSQGTPLGGFRSTSLAGIPQAEAGAVGNAAEGLQASAAQGLAGAAGEQAGIGTGISSTGLGVAGVGQGQTGQGLSALSTAIQAALAKMGINLQGGFANQFNTVAQGINALI